jgi:hypothetical protein
MPSTVWHTSVVMMRNVVKTSSRGRPRTSPRENAAEVPRYFPHGLRRDAVKTIKHDRPSNQEVRRVDGQG